MRDLTAEEHGLLRLVIEELAEPYREQLLRQLEHTVVRGGPVTMLDLGVAAEVARCGVASPLPVGALHEDHSGTPLGLITVWLTNGYLSGLEYGWVSDEPPSTLPPAAAIRIVP
jgi:hypothetical protein